MIPVKDNPLGQAYENTEALLDCIRLFATHAVPFSEWPEPCRCYMADIIADRIVQEGDSLEDL